MKLLNRHAKKPKILLIADMPDWAYHHCMMFIIKQLSHKYDFYYDYLACHHYRHEELVKINPESFLYRLKHNVKVLFLKIFFFYNPNIYEKYSFLHLWPYVYCPFWVKQFDIWGIKGKRRVLPPFKKYDCVYMFDYYFDFVAHLKIRASRIIKGANSDGFPPQGCEYDYKNKRPFAPKSIEEFCRVYYANIDALVVGAPLIGKLYEPYIQPIFFANIAYDENLFSPSGRITSQQEELCIGWTGNPKRAFKNFYTVIVPVIESLKEKGYNIRFKTRFSGPLSTLHEFYQDVDLVVIASTADAGPGLFAEASLCGIPSVSTRIGFPDYVIRDNINGWFFDGTKEDLEKKLIHLLHNKHLIDNARATIRQDYIAKMGVDKMTKAWDDVFQYVLRKNKEK